jgi:hypothetical protein
MQKEGASVGARSVKIIYMVFKESDTTYLKDLTSNKDHNKKQIKKGQRDKEWSIGSPHQNPIS